MARDKKTDMSMALASLGIGMIGLVAAFGAWLFPIPNSQPAITTPESADSSKSLLSRLMPTAVLQISGTGLKVTIRKGPAHTRYAGGEVTSVGTESVVYLPLGQPMRLEVSGTGAEVLVESELLPQIQVTNTATGASVNQF